jgi:quinol monooxygenase YgiN
LIAHTRAPVLVTRLYEVNFPWQFPDLAYIAFVRTLAVLCRHCKAMSGNMSKTNQRPRRCRASRRLFTAFAGGTHDLRGCWQIDTVIRMNMNRKNQQETQQQATSNQLSTRAPASEGSYIYHRPDDRFGSVVTYSRYPSKKSAEPHRVTESFHELAIRCANSAVTSKNDGPTFSPFTYTPLSHGRYSARDCSFLTFTIENVHLTVQPRHILACVDGLASFVYATRMNMNRANRGNYQLVVALRTPIPAEHYKQVAIRFAMRFAYIDGDSTRPTRFRSNESRSHHVPRT